MAVIETGLGGRLDATNVLTPALTITTDISLDHADILGSTVKKIAGEKAGIIKPGVPHLIGELGREARAVMQEACRKEGSPMVSLQRKDFDLDDRRLLLNCHIDGMKINCLKPSLAGRHQLRNSALVLKAVSLLRQHGFKISKAAIKQGVETANWPGRFQIISGRGAASVVVLDVGHNPGGARAFVDTFCRLYPGRKSHFLLGFVKRKEHQVIVDILAPIAKSFFLVPLKTKRSCDVKELATGLNWQGVPVVTSAKLETAHNRLLKIATSDDIISVVGSHYLVGEYLVSEYSNGD